MTLLQEIQKEAVDGTSDLATLLRKCRVLAARLKADEFKNWVQYELDGYPASAELPNYRVTRCQSLGNFLGPYGGGLKNAPIPTGLLPEEYQEIVSKIEFRQGVGALQDLTSRGDGGRLKQDWDADFVACVADKFYETMNLAQAWKKVPKATLVGILETVRNRILNFVLEIESESPNAGEGTTAPALSAEKVSYVFNTNIMGNVGNLASGSSHVHQTATLNIAQGDWKALEHYLRSISVEEVDIRELRDHVESEATPSSKSFSQRVAGWIGKMVAKSAQGLWNVGTNVATNLLTKALSQYCGLPNP